jgi:hypothetical protein
LAEASPKGLLEALDLAADLAADFAGVGLRRTDVERAVILFETCVQAEGIRAERQGLRVR